MTQTYKNKAQSPRQAARRRGAIDKTLNPQLFKALCDPTRASLLACLAKCGRAASVGEVAACCAVDFSVVSRHLAMLARAGVVEASKRGREVLYRVKYAETARTLRALADAFESCCPEGTDCCETEERVGHERGSPRSGVAGSGSDAGARDGASADDSSPGGCCGE